MPYTDKEKQLEYQRRWMAARRAEYFKEKQCSNCGSRTELELDHLDPATKISHKIWSWATVRREAEIAKCRILCRSCHEVRTSIWYGFRREHGTNAMYENGCHCTHCRKCKANYQAAWRRRTGRH